LTAIFGKCYNGIKTPGSATLLSDDENHFIFYDMKIIIAVKSEKN
jgi:hypothetical protein